jgi:glycosyltransferase involved in cell wall biosynthesis
MLSICIPVYNYDCRQLINELDQQANTIDVPVEIIVINDGSGEPFKSIYQNALPARGHYHSLAENTGRSRVRNQFIDLAIYDYLLFLDCDVRITSPDYIHAFIDQVAKRIQVACGGTSYPVEMPDKNKLLHWSYGRSKESALAKKKLADPYASFMTNNFFIKKNILSQIRFDESLSQYGHEDTLFGYELYKKGIQIVHINNPVLHEDLDTNHIFLEKTAQAVQNLAMIINKKPDPQLANSITLSKIYFRLKKTGLIYLLQPFENIINQYCYKKLIKGSASISCLNLYKLCLFSKYYRSRK